ncbi:MAG: tetratricopeptide repeat protein [Chloroflexota bacterium]
MATDLIQQGLAAVKDGNRAEARKLFEQAVEADPDNARAWYYLGRTQSDTEEKRTSFMRVLEIMPENEQAREELDKLPPVQDDAESFDFGFEEPAATPANTAFNFGGDEKPKGPPNEIMTASPTDGFALPIEIPDAPQTVTPDLLINQFVEKFKMGLNILQRKEGAYQNAMRYATWWHFWSYVGIVFLVISLFSTITTVIAVNQAANAAEQIAELGSEFGEFDDTFGTIFSSAISASVTRPNPVTIILHYIITIPVSIAALYAALYAGHWYITKQDEGQSTLIQHAYAIMLPVTTASVIGTALGIVPIVGWIASLALAIYAFWFIAAQGVEMVNRTSGNSKYIALVVQIIAQFVVAAGLGLVLSPVLLG